MLDPEIFQKSENEVRRQSENEVRRQLEALGLTATRIIWEQYIKRIGPCLSVTYGGRDPSGHLVEAKFNVGIDNDMEVFAKRIEKSLITQKRSYDRVEGHPPVIPGPNMAIEHLKFSSPFVKRLQIDHQDPVERRKALTQALITLFKNGSKRLKSNPRPYGISINTNKVDHREELAPNVDWKGTQLVLRGVILPDQIIMGSIGQPITRIIEHPILNERMTILRAFSEVIKTKNSGVTVFETEGDWTWGREI